MVSVLDLGTVFRPDVAELVDVLRRHSNFSFFFFSSRRRHTRFDCDWSSDVCSSDLLIGFLHLGRIHNPQSCRCRSLNSHPAAAPFAPADLPEIATSAPPTRSRRIP